MDHFLVADELEIDTVGIKQVGISVFIALALFDRIALQLDHILVDVLRFAPAKGDAITLKQEIGHPTFGSFGLVDHLDSRINRLEQPFQRRAIAMFGCLPAGIFGLHLIKIVADIHAFSDLDNVALYMQPSPPPRKPLNLSVAAKIA
ncbi:hypothetical protein [Parasphingorhabdus sp.]|uniref:hypothetical protein n=1 Tax=Parasphingorhabdus sp. TaxID=2709688 RepID=UPI003A9295AD